MLRGRSEPSINSGHARCPRHLYNNYNQGNRILPTSSGNENLQHPGLVFRVTARHRHATGYERPCFEVPRALVQTPTLQVTGDICTVVAGAIYEVIYLHRNLMRAWYMDGRCLLVVIKAIQSISAYFMNKVTEYCVPRKPVASTTWCGVELSSPVTDTLRVLTTNHHKHATSPECRGRCITDMLPSTLGGSGGYSLPPTLNLATMYLLSSSFQLLLESVFCRLAD